MTEFMVTTIIVAILTALTYLAQHSTDTTVYTWTLVGFIIFVCLTSLYALLYNLHHTTEEE